MELESAFTKQGKSERPSKEDAPGPPPRYIEVGAVVALLRASIGLLVGRGQRDCRGSGDRRDKESQMRQIFMHVPKYQKKI